MTTKLLLVDDDPTILESFPTYFATTQDLEVVGTATTGRKALHWLESNICDLILSDVYMPDIDGIDLLQLIRKHDHPPLFVSMTAFDTDETMLRCLSLGAVGYIIKGQEPETIIHSIRVATHGGTSLSPDCLSRLVKIRTPDEDLDSSKPVAPSLSHREQVILSLISEGKTNREIGESLRLAEITVRTVISHLFWRFSARNRVDLAVKYQSVKDSYQR
ncbi:response regulator transcription factor [Corynebacterium breve]|uniref:Response regulator transcription factor n=1 Tax=Corynebacterium breve TaxID=3049799 RepID=A0ABY8VMB7_9CORY|nr:response regulator transcription factor [Corynebacterium breve]WIM68705.1 response regulator transcription factor [Corynebacterium breve]